MLTVNKDKLCDNELICAGFRLCEEIVRDGYEAYLVGGCVRDILLDQQIHDVDVATNMPLDKLKAKFYWHDNNGEKHGTILVNFAGHYIETTQFRTDGNYSDGRHPDDVEFGQSFEEDTKRRDFTINAMGIDYTGKIVDYQHGQDDIAQCLIRTVGDPYERFKEDALRMIRAIRFAARFGFVIEHNTAQAIKDLKENIELVARERIGEEIKKAISYGTAAFKNFVDLLDKSGLALIIGQGLVNWSKTEKLIDRYRNEIADNTIPVCREDIENLMLVFMLEPSRDLDNAVKAFRYDNKLLGLLKYIRQYKDLGTADVFSKKNFVRLVKASTSPHFSLFLNYMRTLALFELSDFELQGIAHVAESLEKIHDFVADAMAKCGYTGKTYGEVLAKFEEWYCYETWHLKQPDEHMIRMFIMAHIIKD